MKHKKIKAGKRLLLKKRTIARLNDATLRMIGAGAKNEFNQLPPNNTGGGGGGSNVIYGCDSDATCVASGCASCETVCTCLSACC